MRSLIAISIPTVILEMDFNTEMNFNTVALYIATVLIDMWLLGFVTKAFLLILWEDGFVMQACDPLLVLLLIALVHYLVYALLSRSENEFCRRERDLIIWRKILLAGKDSDIQMAKLEHWEEANKLRRANEQDLSDLNAAHEQELRALSSLSAPSSGTSRSGLLSVLGCLSCVC